MIDKLQLSQAEVEELSQPFSRKEAQEAFRHGLACSLSSNGLLPSQVEEMLKLAGDGISTSPTRNFVDLVKDYGTFMVGTGAALGAGSGYLRHNIECNVAGNDDPELITLRKKIDAYKNMSRALQ